MIVYSVNGMEQNLDMTQTTLASADRLLLSEITLDGLRPLDTLRVTEGELQLQLPKGLVGTLSQID